MSMIHIFTTVAFVIPFIAFFLSQEPIIFPCSEEIKKESVSPDGKYVAVLLEQNCGATTSYGTHINIRSASGRFRAKEDGAIKEGQVFNFRGQPSITITWVTNTILWIDCKDCQAYNIFQHDFKWQGIDIVYEKPDIKAFAARDAQIATTVNAQDQTIIKALSEKIMQAGVNSDVDSLNSLVSQGKQGKEAIQQLTALFQKRNLFSGYKYIDFNPPENMRYKNPDKTICQVVGTIYYAKGYPNDFVATFIRDGNSWKLHSVQKIGALFTR